MTIKELKRLSRAELLQMLLYRTREAEDLRTQVESLQEQLRQKELLILESGSIAEAAIKINGVLEAAQAAADQYLLNIARLEAEAKQKVAREGEETL